MFKDLNRIRNDRDANMNIKEGDRIPGLSMPYNYGNGGSGN
jgi:hypothetical protein